MTFPADGLTASIMAIEGVADCRVLLNGPLGCKFYHGHISDRQFGRHQAEDGKGGSRYLFGQRRLPCTFLDEWDYINGAGAKLVEVLEDVPRDNEETIVVINSPGASLIGDDIETLVSKLGLSERVQVIESPGVSQPLSRCYDATMCSFLQGLDLGLETPSRKTVNLLGLSIMHQHWRGSVDWLREILSRSGIAVNAVIGAGSSTLDLRHSASAALNVVVHEEYAISTARWYWRKLGIPYVVCKAGAPFGFEATEEWLGGIGECLGVSVNPSIQAMQRSKELAKWQISRFNALTGLPKGAAFGIRGDASMTRPLTKWLLEYLGMAPEAVSVSAGGSERSIKDLEGYLQTSGFSEAWGADLEERGVDVAMADGHTISSMKLAERCRVGIELSLPVRTRYDFSGKTYIGNVGAMYLLDEIINGLNQVG